MAYNSLADIWADYDVKERKKFMDYDVSAAVSELPAGNPEEEQCRYEALAFSFTSSPRPNKWGTYYGHRYTYTKEDNGEEKICVPDIKSVTPEAIAYWEKRASEVVNPLLKMRYTGLVQDFKKRITGETPDYKSIKLANVYAIIDVVEGDYCKYEMEQLMYAERALKLARGFRNEALKQRVVKAYYEAHLRAKAIDSHVGIWSKIVQSLIKYRGAFGQYEKLIVKENEDRLARMESNALAADEKGDDYVFTMGEQVDLLCEYYHSIGADEKVEPMLDRLLTVTKLPIAARGGMWGQSMLEHMQKRFRQYGLDRRANKLFVDIQNLGELALKELKSTRLSVPFDNKRIKMFLRAATEGTVKECLERYIIEYIPIREKEIKNQKENAKRDPLLDMVTTMIIDAAGNTTNKVGVGKNAEERKLYHSMYKNMQFVSFLMQMHMDELKNKKEVTVDSLMKLFDGSPLMTESNNVFLRRGLEAYMNDDYIVCCHLLIPLFESMVRRLIALNGGEVLRQSADPAEGNEYYSLDSLLDSPVAQECIKEDMITYFKALLVSPGGWNLRNLVSHGLLRAGSFNRMMSDRVVHAVLVLSLFKPIE